MRRYTKKDDLIWIIINVVIKKIVFELWSENKSGF